MLNRMAMVLVVGMAMVPIAAGATIVNGTFAGIIDSGGSDTSGVFGTPLTDLSGLAITGTFYYDTDLLSSSIVGDTNTASGLGIGALTVTITIGGGSHIFTDQTSSSVYLDTAVSQFTIQNANSQSADPTSVAETFFLDVLDPSTPFVLSTDLVQAFSAVPLLGSGTFSINNTGPNAVSSAGFSVTEVTLSPVPEPASLGALLAGLAGLATVRARRARRV